MPGELDGVIQVQMRVGGGGFEAPPPMPGGGVAPSTALTIPPSAIPTAIGQYLPAGFEQLTTEQRAMKKNMEEAFKLQRESLDFQKMLAKITGSKEDEQKEKSNPAFQAISKFIPYIAGAFGIGAIISSSKLISGVLSASLELLGALVDVIFMPLMPILVPTLQLIGKVISLLVPLMTQITTWVSAGVKLIGDFFGSMGKDIGLILAWAAQFVPSLVTGLQAGFNSITSTLTTWLGWLGGILGGVKNWVESVWYKLVEVVNNIISLPQQIANALGKGGESAGEFLGNLGKNMGDAWDKWLREHNPFAPKIGFISPFQGIPAQQYSPASYSTQTPLSITSNVYIYGSQGTSTNTEEIRRAVRSGIEEGVNKVVSERLKYHAS